MMERLIEEAKEFVKSFHEGDATGHDWWHVYRVWKTAAWIAEPENADRPVCELAALLHDLDDWKLAGSDQSGDPVRARAWLLENGVAEEKVEQIINAIRDVSFKGAGVDTQPKTKEGEIVQDADRLDAIGAIGIGRAFAFGGAADRAMHDPDQQPRLHPSFDAYKSGKSTTVNHFYEKLLLLKDRMNTETGKRLAQERHRFLEVFLAQFLEEWNGPQTAP